MLNQSSTEVDFRNFCFEVPYSPDTPIFESGSGIRVKDLRGREYIDAISGVFVTSFGHSCQPIIDAMSTQLQKLAFPPPLHSLNKLSISLASELVELSSLKFDCAKLFNGGSESIEAALRITRLYHSAKGNHKKLKILSNYNGYHGSTYGSLSLTGRADTTRFGPKMPGFIHVWPADCFACPYDLEYPGCQTLCASMIEKTIQAEGPESVAAIFVEPIIHLVGMAVPPKSYFRQLREICDRYNILLVFDEIVTGFGRTGAFFAADTFEVKPDLMCVGKGVTGGYAPLAAVLMSEGVSAILRDQKYSYASFAPSHTYAGNPVSAAAGLAAVNLLKSGNYLFKVREQGSYLQEKLEETVGVYGRVRGMGLLWGCKLNPPNHLIGLNHTRLNLGSHVQQACMKRGLIIRGQEDMFVIAPAFICSHQDIDRICQLLKEALQEVYTRISRQYS